MSTLRERLDRIRAGFLEAAPEHGKAIMHGSPSTAATGDHTATRSCQLCSMRTRS
jgi:hypothetical protein